MIAVIIDSHPVFLNGLTQFLSGLYTDVSVFKFLNINSFEKEKHKIRPDFMIVGVNNFFKPKDLKIFESLRRSLPGTAIILFYDELNMVLPFLKSGANGFLAKKGAPEEMVDCLNMVNSGKRYLNNEVFNWIVNPSV